MNAEAGTITPVQSKEIKGRPDHYWDALVEGDQIVSPGITISESHLVQWAGLTGDWVSLHLDAEYAATTPFGQRIGHGPLTLAVGLGLMTQTGYFTNVVAWLGLDEVRAVQPVFIGDTIHAEVTVRTARETKRPDAGIWTLDYTVVKQDGTKVMTFTTSLMIKRR